MVVGAMGGYVPLPVTRMAFSAQVGEGIVCHNGGCVLAMGVY